MTTELASSDFQFALKCTVFQVGYSSLSNMIGTVFGHPIDTVRVSNVMRFNPQMLGEDANDCQSVLHIDDSSYSQGRRRK